jgi:hypothetical protein
MRCTRLGAAEFEVRVVPQNGCAYDMLPITNDPGGRIWDARMLVDDPADVRP